MANTVRGGFLRDESGALVVQGSVGGGGGGGGGVVSVIYANGAYPARPASAIMAIFRGPVAPTIGGAGNAVDGVDIWVQTS